MSPERLPGRVGLREPPVQELDQVSAEQLVNVRVPRFVVDLEETLKCLRDISIGRRHRDNVFRQTTKPTTVKRTHPGMSMPVAHKAGGHVRQTAPLSAGQPLTTAEQVAWTL